MGWRLVAASVVIGVIVGAFARRSAPGKIRHDESRPDNLRFATWDEAFNRPVTDKLAFRIEYQDFDGVVTERTIRPLSIHLTRGEPDVHIKAFCELRGAERTFHSGRIRRCVNQQTGRQLRDLGRYLRGKY